MLDSKGTLVGISFDVVQTKVNFDATGTITTDLGYRVQDQEGTQGRLQHEARFPHRQGVV